MPFGKIVGILHGLAILYDLAGRQLGVVGFENCLKRWHNHPLSLPGPLEFVSVVDVRIGNVEVNHLGTIHIPNEVLSIEPAINPALLWRNQITYQLYIHLEIHWIRQHHDSCNPQLSLHLLCGRVSLRPHPLHQGGNSVLPPVIIEGFEEAGAGLGVEWVELLDVEGLPIPVCTSYLHQVPLARHHHKLILVLLDQQRVRERCVAHYDVFFLDLGTTATKCTIVLPVDNPIQQRRSLRFQLPASIGHKNERNINCSLDAAGLKATQHTLDYLFGSLYSFATPLNNTIDIWNNGWQLYFSSHTREKSAIKLEFLSQIPWKFDHFLSKYA